MKRTRALVLAATGAILTAGIATASLGPAGAVVETDFLEFTTAEYVTFGYDAGAAYVQYTGPGDPQLSDLSEAITTPTVDDVNNRIDIVVDSRCTIINRDEVAQLLGLESPNRGHRVQLYENGLGTGDARCTPSGGRIGSDGKDESAVSWLEFSPGTELPEGIGDFTAARLNVEGKFDTSLSYSFDSGASFEAPLLLSAAGGDNGNDANGDNYLIPISASEPFASLRVAPTFVDGNRTELAIDNGGDSDDSDLGSVFYFGGQVFEYTVDCGDVVSETSDIYEDAGVVEPIKVTYLRLENRPRGDSGIEYGLCEPIGLQIDFVKDGANDGAIRDTTEVLNSATSAVGVPQALRARVKIEWRVPRLNTDGTPRSVDDLELELQREIVYPESDGTDTDPVPVPYCLSIADDPAENDGTSEYDLFNPADPSDPGIAVHPADRPVGEPSWCVLSDDRVLDGDTIIQTMILDAAGDPGMW